MVNIKNIIEDRKVKWIVTILLPLFVWLLLETNSRNAQINLFFLITLIGILAFLLELLPSAITGILMMTSYVFTGLAPMSVVFSGWAQESIWITFCCLMLVVVFQKTTLMERIAYKLVVLSGGSYKGILFSLYFSAIIVNLFIPGSLVGVLVITLAYSLCQSLGFKNTKAAAGIMLGAVTTGFHDVESFIICPGYYTLITDSAKGIVDLEVNHFTYFSHTWFMIPLTIFMVFVLNKMFAPKEMGNVKEKFQNKLNQMEKVNKNEKKLIVVLGILFIYLMTTSIHGLSMMYGFIFVAVIPFFPGMQLCTEEDIFKVKYPTLIFMVSCLSIGYVAVSLGIGDMIANFVSNNLTNPTPIVLVMGSFFLAVIANLLMTPFAALSSLGPTLATISNSLGISFYPITYAFFYGCNTIFFPYETALYAIMYSFGNVKLKYLLQFMIVRFIIWSIYLAVLGSTYWNYLGFF